MSWLTAAFDCISWQFVGRNRKGRDVEHGNSEQFHYGGKVNVRHTESGSFATWNCCYLVWHNII